MPFKTRTKKVAAARHRVSLSEDGYLAYTSKAGNKLKMDKSPEPFMLDGFIGTQVKRDIIKILLLAGVIIGFQLAIKLLNLPIFK